MEWKEVIERFPNSWVLFRMWMDQNLEAPWNTDSDEIFNNYYEYTYTPIRDHLFVYFFDEFSIKIEIENMINSCNSVVQYNDKVMICEDFDSRIKAENDAYFRAFEIMEENILINNN